MMNHREGSKKMTHNRLLKGVVKFRIFPKVERWELSFPHGLLQKSFSVANCCVDNHSKTKCLHLSLFIKDKRKSQQNKKQHQPVCYFQLIHYHFIVRNSNHYQRGSTIKD